jgi:hypothetical protein
MLKSEKESKQMVLQSQLQIAAIFVEVLKLKELVLAIDSDN